MRTRRGCAALLGLMAMLAGGRASNAQVTLPQPADPATAKRVREDVLQTIDLWARGEGPSDYKEGQKPWEVPFDGEDVDKSFAVITKAAVLDVKNVSEKPTGPRYYWANVRVSVAASYSYPASPMKVCRLPVRGDFDERVTVSINGDQISFAAPLSWPVYYRAALKRELPDELLRQINAGPKKCETD